MPGKKAVFWKGKLAGSLDHLRLWAAQKIYSILVLNTYTLHDLLPFPIFLFPQAWRNRTLNQKRQHITHFLATWSSH